MAVLTAAQRAALVADHQRDKSTRREAIPVSKSDLALITAAVDDELNATERAFVTRLPARLQSALPDRHLAELLRDVATRRAEVK